MEDILKKYSKELFSYAVFLTRNLEDAKDLYQDTCVKALDAKNEINKTKNIRGWLRTVMRNHFITNYRKSKVRASIQIEEHDPYDSVLPTYILPDSMTLTKEIIDKIEALPSTVKRTLILRMNGHRYKEISDKLDINLNTVKSRIHRARKQLKQN